MPGPAPPLALSDDLTLPQLLEQSRQATLRGLWLGLPGTVERYDAATSAADVQPSIRVRRTGEDGADVYEALPVIPACPVLQLGGGGARLTFALTKGDPVLVLFSGVALGAWLDRGGTVDAEDDRRGHLTDGIVIPGLRSFASPLASCPDDHATLGADAGPQIHLRGATITIGDEAGAQFVALANLVGSALSTLKAAISGAAVVPNDGGAALKANILAALATWPPSVAATQAKAK